MIEVGLKKKKKKNQCYVTPEVLEPGVLCAWECQHLIHAVPMQICDKGIKHEGSNTSLLMPEPTLLHKQHDITLKSLHIRRDFKKFTEKYVKR